MKFLNEVASLAYLNILQINQSSSDTERRSLPRIANCSSLGQSAIRCQILYTTGRCIVSQEALHYILNPPIIGSSGNMTGPLPLLRTNALCVVPNSVGKRNIQHRTLHRTSSQLFVDKSNDECTPPSPDKFFYPSTN